MLHPQAHSARIKVFSKERFDQLNTTAYRFWAAGIAASILSGIYKLRGISARSVQARKTQSSPEKEADRKVEVKNLSA
jgi:peroxin-11B